MYRQSEKKLFKPIRPHNTVNFGPLTAEIGWRVWGTRANFDGFRVLASLLHRHRSAEVNQTLHDVWPSPELVHYIYIFRGLLPPDGILPGAKVTLRPSLAFSHIGTSPHGIPATDVSQTLRRGTKNVITELVSTQKRFATRSATWIA